MKEKIIANRVTPEVGQNDHFTHRQPSFLPFLFYYFFIYFLHFIFLFNNAIRVRCFCSAGRRYTVAQTQAKVLVLPIQPRMKINYSAWRQLLIITQLMRLSELLWIVILHLSIIVQSDRVTCTVVKGVFVFFLHTLYAHINKWPSVLFFLQLCELHFHPSFFRRASL